MTRRRRSFCKRSEFRADASLANRILIETAFVFVAITVIVAALYHAKLPFAMHVTALGLISVVYGLTVFRCFVIAHDCAHLSFYNSARANRWLGNFLSAFTLTPFKSFSTNHLRHHRVANMLGNTLTKFNHTVWFTTEEYLNLPILKRYAYRALREPIIFFVLVPALNFMRGLVWGKQAWQPGLMALATGYALQRWGGLELTLGWLLANYLFNFLVIYGVHIQHTFNPGYCLPASDWSFSEAAFKGSSFHTTFGLGWFFMGVEHHSLHHFAQHVPVYKLAACYAKGKSTLWHEMQQHNLKKQISSLGLVLFNQTLERYQSFRDASSHKAKATSLVILPATCEEGSE